MKIKGDVNEFTSKLELPTSQSDNDRMMLLSGETTVAAHRLSFQITATTALHVSRYNYLLCDLRSRRVEQKSETSKQLGALLLQAFKLNVRAE